jgi:hypothetical protein
MCEAKKDDKSKLEELLEQQAENMRQYGWVMHFVMNDSDYPNGINYHTHGLRENFGHPDMQICLPIRPGLAHSIISVVVERIREGEQYVTGKEYHDLLADDMKVIFLEVKEDQRKMLRLILPDEDGGYNQPYYAEQLNV